MKFIKITLLLTLPITLLLLFGCGRTYEDGYTEEISWYAKTYDVIFGKPIRKQLKPIEKMKLTGDEEVDANIVAFNKRVDSENERINIHNKGAQEDREDPDNGLIPLIGIIMASGGVGWARTFITKKNVEKIRDLAIDEKKVAQVRYQASKDAVRDDVGLLSKVKSLAAIAAQTIKDQKEIYEKHGDTIDGVRRAYIEISNKKS